MNKLSNVSQKISKFLKETLRGVGKAVKYLLIPSEEAQKSIARRTGYNFDHPSSKRVHVGRFYCYVPTKTNENTKTPLQQKIIARKEQEKINPKTNLSIKESAKKQTSLEKAI